jgi:hypothetical protein
MVGGRTVARWPLSIKRVDRSPGEAYDPGERLAEPGVSVHRPEGRSGTLAAGTGGGAMSYERLEDVRRRESRDVHVAWLVGASSLALVAVFMWVFFR